LDALKRIGFLVLTLFVVSAVVGCEEDTTRPEAPPPPPPISLQTYALSNDASTRLPDNDVYDIYVDSQDRIWFATEAGVAMKDGASDMVVFDDQSTNGDIANRKTRAVIEYHSKIFLGTWGGGVSVYNGTKWLQLPVKAGSAQGVVDGQVTALAPDPNGRDIWIATVAGVTRYRDEAIPMLNRFAQFSSFLGPEGDAWNLTDVFVRVDPIRGKEIWLAKLIDGITVIRFSPTKAVQYKPSNSAIPSVNCTGVAFDTMNGLFWASFGNKGIASVDVNAAIWKNLTRVDGFGSDLVSSIAVRSNGDVWAGTQTGVSRLHDDGAGNVTVTNFVAGSGLPDGRVRKVYIDPQDNVWLAFVEGGAAKVLNP
jgi:ligand-binding sensor domain-containing protein